MQSYVAIEIGGTKLQIVVGDEKASIQERFRLNVDRVKGASGIREQIASTIKQFAIPPKAIGVGFGGPVDWHSGRICVSHQISGWSDFDLRSWLQALVPVPVFVDNDANVAALGEAYHGAGKGKNPMLYVTLGSGVGAGLVVDGRIYHGAIPGEAEIGHIRLDRSGATVESRCSGWAVDQKIREAIRREPASLLAQHVGSATSGEAKFLAAALAQADPLAQRLLQEVVDDLAFGFSHAVHLFHPEVIVLGGGLSLMGEALRSGVAKRLPDYIMEAFLPGPLIQLAALQEDAVPMGALELARRLGSVD